jgi:peptidoglycan/LPS O-acetylase OafA/YrhL
VAVSLKVSDPSYKPQLDGLRAVAVAAVAWSHWERDLQFGIPFGAGVHLFYVLSGFLITGILLGLRGESFGHPIKGCPPKRVEEGATKTDLTRVLSAFYARRTLRIVPAFYLTLAIALLAGLPTVRDSVWWHAGYLSNVWIFTRAQWPGNVSHFWSLAVEEQFYLVWPCFILFAPSRWLGPGIAAAIAISPLFRAAVVSAGYREALQALLMPGCLDSLGMGALLAWVAATKPNRYASFTRTLLHVGVPGWLALLLVRNTGADVPVLIAALEQVLQACVFGWLVASAAGGFRGWLGRVLESTPAVYVGRISYGVYLAHGFAGAIVAGLLSVVGLNGVVLPEPLRFIALTSVTLASAALSWRFIEAPVLVLKSRLPYEARPGLRTAPTGGTPPSVASAIGPRLDESEDLPAPVGIAPSVASVGAGL